jgi:hypothetical protein
MVMPCQWKTEMQRCVASPGTTALTEVIVAAPSAVATDLHLRARTEAAVAEEEEEEAHAEVLHGEVVEVAGTYRAEVEEFATAIMKEIPKASSIAMLSPWQVMTRCLLTTSWKYSRMPQMSE